MSSKAFELCLVKQKITIGERIKIKIESIEHRGKSLYLGTNDSFVIELKLGSGRTLQTEEGMAYKYLGLKKPVVFLRGICILERILCVCDSNLIVLNQNDLEVISYGNKLKNISALCLNENPNNNNPFSVQLCVARRKQLTVFNMTSEKMIAIKEVSIPQFVLTMAMDGQHLCVGTDSQFLIVNWETSQIQDLCCVDSEIAVPVCKRISKEEFLISGPSALGLFVKSTGISERPPIQWSSDIVAIAYSHPYILAINDNCISIFSIVDQQLKQSIPFNGGIYLDNFDGNILIATDDSVFQLKPIPWEKQLQSLISLRKVKEALDLSLNWREAGLSQENYNQILSRVKRDSALIELSLKHFEEAKQLFLESKSDVLEMINVFDDILPENLRPEAINYFINDFNFSVNKDIEDYEEYKNFLIHFLEDLYLKRCQQYEYRKKYINSALICLYSDDKKYSSKLSELLNHKELDIDINWISKHLKCNHCYHSLALLYSRNESTYEEAIDIWVKLEDNDLSDPLYPGLQCLADFLARIDSKHLILKYIDFILEKDEKLGVSVLIKQDECVDNSNDDIKAEQIIKYLHKYPIAEQLYLEHLVFEKKTQNEVLETNLCLKYINRLNDLKSDQSLDEFNETRIKLQNLLKDFEKYKIRLILEKITETGLDFESTILYGKLGEHGKALTVIVEKMHDFSLAQQYCLQFNSKQHNLFHKLLAIYLSLSQRNIESSDDWMNRAIDLLNSKITEFDAIKVLSLIPQMWTLSSVQQFLNKSIRQSMHRKRISLVAKGLAKSEILKQKHQKVFTERQILFLNEDSICMVCGTAITEPQFKWYPSLQILVHSHCCKNLSNNQS